jgi:hypothetical protein
VPQFHSGGFQQTNQLIVLIFQTHHVEIVLEESLNAVKSTYKNITSCHVYSVQKSKLKDSNALYIVDYDLLKKQIFNSNQ